MKIGRNDEYREQAIKKELDGLKSLVFFVIWILYAIWTIYSNWSDYREGGSQLLGFLWFLVSTAFILFVSFLVIRFAVEIIISIINGIRPLTNAYYDTTNRIHQSLLESSIKLRLGVSTGALSKRGHSNGIEPYQIINLTDDDCCQNIITIGGIGSGKTTRVINPLLLQLLDSNKGGLIFDIKGDFKESVYSLGEARKDDIVTIGIGQRRFNLLKGLTPEQASSYLQSTFVLVSGSTNDFWLQSATDLCRNVLGVLEPLGDEYYNLETLYQYIFSDSTRLAIDGLIDDELSRLGHSTKGRSLRMYKSYFSDVFMNLDVKMRESVKGTISAVLSPFQNPHLIDTFSVNDFDIYDILKGKIVIIDLPLAMWGVGGKVVYTLIKLRYFALLQQRQYDKSLPQDHVFFMCDEYQEIISANRQGLSDLSFWDKSRSARCIGIISTQSVNSFRSVISNKAICDTILANFRQKIFFKTEDVETINMIQSLIGKTTVIRTNHSTSKGESGKSLSVKSYSETESTSHNLVDQSIIEPHMIRGLDQDHAVAILNIQGISTDDIIELEPIYC